MANEYEGRERFTPVPGRIYTNKGGGEFRCLNVGKGTRRYTATMQNVVSGWTFTAHDIGRYPDDTIDWDYTTHGTFKEVNE